jgi:hypothetical protein
MLELYFRVSVHRKRFLFNNQTGALIIQILFWHKILHVSDIFSAHHQDFSAVHSALVSFIQVLMTAFKQSQDGTAPSWFCLEAVIKTSMKLTSAECTVENSRWWREKMYETCRVLWQNNIWIISASGWLFKRNVGASLLFDAGECSYFGS